MQPKPNAVFKARIKDNIIEVWAVGKWRQLRQYSPKKLVPSETIQRAVLHSVWLNTGKYFDLSTARLDFASEVANDD